MEDRKRGRDDEEGGAEDAAGKGGGREGGDAPPAAAAPAENADQSWLLPVARFCRGVGSFLASLLPLPPFRSPTAGPSADDVVGLAPPPFHGPAADSALGERCIDVLPIVSASGFAAEVSQCRELCGETWRAGDLGATNDMLVRSAEIQCGAQAARETRREDFVHPTAGYTLRGTTQLIRAALLNNLPRVLQLVQLGAPIDLVEEGNKMSALHWACNEGHEHVAKALLDGKYEGRGADVNLQHLGIVWTPLMAASRRGREGVVRLLLERGARLELQDSTSWTALHSAVYSNHAVLLEALCSAQGAAAALAQRDSNGQKPLALAIASGRAACEAVLRAHGATA